jgi:uncharacterized protein (DUF1330 family)
MGVAAENRPNFFLMQAGVCGPDVLTIAAPVTLGSLRRCNPHTKKGGRKMKRLFGAAAIVAAGIAIGAGGMQALHAQSKPVAIAVSEIDVKDMEAYKQWLPAVQKDIADAGGKYLAGGFNKTTSLIGAPPANRLVIIQYPDADSLKTWWHDKGEASIKAAEKFASFRIYSVEGIEQK